MVRETVSYLHSIIASGEKTILVEGAQSTILDIDFGENEKIFLLDIPHPHLLIFFM